MESLLHDAKNVNVHVRNRPASYDTELKLIIPLPRDILDEVEYAGRCILGCRDGHATEPPTQTQPIEGTHTGSGFNARNGQSPSRGQRHWLSKACTFEISRGSGVVVLVR